MDSFVLFLMHVEKHYMRVDVDKTCKYDANTRQIGLHIYATNRNQYNANNEMDVC